MARPGLILDECAAMGYRMVLIWGVALHDAIFVDFRSKRFLGGRPRCGAHFLCATFVLYVLGVGGF